MNTNDRIPRFFVVGGSRCGTTTLHHALTHHPEIYVPPDKSPNFFTAEDMADYPGSAAMAAMKGHTVTNETEYRALFASAREEQLLGEVSPVYLQSIHSAARIARYSPGAKIVAILRDPVDRAFAHFVGRRRDGLETRTRFQETIAGELADPRPRPVAFNCYLAIGQYGYFLKSFYDAFPAGRIKLLFFDDLVRDPVAVLQDLFGFLGVAPLGDRLPLEQKNRGGIIRNPLLRAVWTRTALLRAGLRRHLPGTIRDAVGKLFLSHMQRPTLDPPLRDELRGYFEDDLRLLEVRSGRRLDAWRHAASQDGESIRPRPIP